MKIVHFNIKGAMMSENLKNTLTINKYMSQDSLLIFCRPCYKTKVATGRGVRRAEFPAKSEPIICVKRKTKRGSGLPQRACSGRLNNKRS